MGRVLPLLMIIVLLSSHGALGSSTRTGSNLGTASNSNAGNNRTYSNNIVLNIYLNNAAKVLVAGYADSINGLSFLKTSQYSYDQDTKQLYVPTNSLTYNQWTTGWQSFSQMAATASTTVLSTCHHWSR